MSNEARDWAWQQATKTPTEKLVLVAMAQFADRRGCKVYPGVQRLAGMAGLSERMTQYVLRSLEAQRLVAVDVPGGGKGNPTRYKLPLTEAAAAPPPEPQKAQPAAPFTGPDRVQPAAPNGHAPAGQRVQYPTPKGAIQRRKGCNGLHPTSYEPLIEPPKGERERATAAPPPPAPAPPAGLKVIEGGKAKPSRFQPLPDDFAPDAVAATLAQTLGLDLPRCLRMFRDDAARGAKRSADWQAQFRLWLDREPGFASAPVEDDPWGTRTNPVFAPQVGRLGHD